MNVPEPQYFVASLVSINLKTNGLRACDAPIVNDMGKSKIPEYIEVGQSPLS